MCGVPQGSALGPQLLSIDAAPFSGTIHQMCRNNNLMSHFYADDTQIYITVKPGQEDIDTAVECIERYVTEIRIWMKTNSLKLNYLKTKVIVFRTAQQLIVGRHSSTYQTNCSFCDTSTKFGRCVD